MPGGKRGPMDTGFSIWKWGVKVPTFGISGTISSHWKSLCRGVERESRPESFLSEQAGRHDVFRTQTGEIKIKNLGNSYDGFVNIQILYRFMDETGFPNSFPQNLFPLNLSENQQKWLQLKLFYWPLRDTTTKERVVFQIKIIPAPGNPEVNLSNNVYSRAFHPDGLF